MSVLASAYKDLNLHQWLDGSLQHNYRPKSHEEPIQSISWGKDGSWLVIVPHSGPTELISIKENMKLLQTIQDISHPTCASFHTTTKKLVGIGTLSGQVMIYDIKGKNIKKRFPRASSKICSLHYNSKDTHIAATCNNGDILLMNCLTSNISTVYKIPNSSLASAANFHPLKRNLFAAGSTDGIIATWDINSNHMLSTNQAHQGEISSIVFSPLRNDLIVTGGLDRKFSLYDLSLQKSIMEVEVKNAVTSIDFSHCGTYLAVGFQNGNILVYDTRRSFNAPLSSFAAHQGHVIRHLLFQKVLSNSKTNNSTIDVTMSETPCTSEGGDGCQINTQSVFDSFEIAACDNSTVQNINAQTHKEYADSFLLALGLDATASIQNESNIEFKSTKDDDRLGDSIKNYTSDTKGYSNILLHKPDHLKTSSTPKLVEVKPMDIIESPILASNQMFSINYQNQKATTSVPTDDLQTMIRGIVQQEVKQVVEEQVKEVIHEELKLIREELRKDMQRNTTDIVNQVKRNFLDLQMCVVREFINFESLLQHKNS